MGMNRLCGRYCRLLTLGTHAYRVAPADQKHGTIDSQTKITRKLNKVAKRAAEEEMSSKRKVPRKAIEQWEGEGSAVLPKKRGGER